MSIHYPDGTVVDDSYLTLCLNTNPYTFLGNRPLNVAPDAGLFKRAAREIAERGTFTALARGTPFTEIDRSFTPAAPGG